MRAAIVTFAALYAGFVVLAAYDLRGGAPSTVENCGPFDEVTDPDGYLWVCVDERDPHWKKSDFRSRPGDPGYEGLVFAAFAATPLPSDADSCCGPTWSCEACEVGE